jgi:FHA domain
LGRRPYNDVVIDNLAVSGEHAVLQMSGSEVYLEDLNSTNGSYVNGKAVKKQQLMHGDTVEIGKYKIKYVSEASLPAYDKTMVFKPAAAALMASAATTSALVDGAGLISASNASIKVMSGAAAGRVVALVKVVTTIGKPGVAVAAITKRPQGFVLAHIEGTDRPTLNGAAIGSEAVTLKNGDLLELAGTQMQFLQH